MRRPEEIGAELVKLADLAEDAGRPFEMPNRIWGELLQYMQIRDTISRLAAVVASAASS